MGTANTLTRAPRFDKASGSSGSSSIEGFSDMGTLPLSRLRRGGRRDKDVDFLLRSTFRTTYFDKMIQFMLRLFLVAATGRALFFEARR